MRGRHRVSHLRVASPDDARLDLHAATLRNSTLIEEADREVEVSRAGADQAALEAATAATATISALLLVIYDLREQLDRVRDTV